MMDYDEIRNALQTLCHPASERLPEGQRLTLLIQRGQQAADAIVALRRERDEVRRNFDDALTEALKNVLNQNAAITRERDTLRALLREAGEALTQITNVYIGMLWTSGNDGEESGVVKQAKDALAAIDEALKEDGG